MDVKQAVKIAKDYVREVFSDDEPANIALEEVEFADTRDEWRVTIGFSRPWERPNQALKALLGPIDFNDDRPRKRVMKVVTISDTDNRIVSVRNRDGS